MVLLADHKSLNSLLEDCHRQRSAKILLTPILDWYSREWKRKRAWLSAQHASIHLGPQYWWNTQKAFLCCSTQSGTGHCYGRFAKTVKLSKGSCIHSSMLTKVWGPLLRLKVESWEHTSTRIEPLNYLRIFKTWGNAMKERISPGTLDKCSM